MCLKRALLRIFTWWNGQTVGTWLFTKREGVRVGADDQGNVYYKQKSGHRRWVIYNGVSEASRIPPEWHAWIHYTVDEIPSEMTMPRQEWEKEHQPNLTGTEKGYAPAGSLARSGRADRVKVSGDYEAWKPQ